MHQNCKFFCVCAKQVEAFTVISEGTNRVPSSQSYKKIIIYIFCDIFFFCCLALYAGFIFKYISVTKKPKDILKQTRAVEKTPSGDESQ